VIGLVASIASFFLYTEYVTFLAEQVVDLDMGAMDPGGGPAWIDPPLYSIRAGRLVALSDVEFRTREDEPFVAGDPAEFGRYRAPASAVQGDTLSVQIRYTSIFLRKRTAWIRRDVRPALVKARTLFLYEGQLWATVEDGSLRFDVQTDRVGKVSYTLDDGPEIALPAGVERVPLATRPGAYSVLLRTIDGRLHEERIVLDRARDEYTLDFGNML